MLKFIIINLILITTAFGATLLEKRAQSGYVIPEYSFTKDCKVDDEGFMESTIIKGDGTAVGFSNPVSKTQIMFVQRLLRQARHGKIDELPMSCDVGTTSLKGFVKGEMVELDVALDCETHRVNLSFVTPLLVAIAKDICKF